MAMKPTPKPVKVSFPKLTPPKMKPSMAMPTPKAASKPSKKGC